MLSVTWFPGSLMKQEDTIQGSLDDSDIDTSIAASVQILFLP